MRVLIFGATGMIGHGVLLEALDDENIEQVLSVGRRTHEIEHAKLQQLVHQDFTDFAAVADQLTGFDACFWCLGVSAGGMSEARYREITVDYTMAAARVLAKRNPEMVFCFISGAGTDRGSRQMWARTKAEAEDQLKECGFRSLYNFRPAGIQPMRGVRSTITSYRVMYAITSPLYPLLKGMKKYITSTPEVGHAMIHVAQNGWAKITLENIDICAAAASYHR